MCLTEVLNPVDRGGNFFRTDYSKHKKMVVFQRGEKRHLAYHTDTHIFFNQNQANVITEPLSRAPVHFPSAGLHRQNSLLRL